MTEPTTPLPAAALTALGLTVPTPVNAGGVTPLQTPHGKVWIKTVEPPTKRARRAAIDGLSRILPIPILRPSKAGKGGDTLIQQAEQNDALRAAGIPVPTTLYADHDFLIQSDSGLNIEHAVNYAEIRQQHGWDEPTVHDILITMTETLAQMHAKGFAHGRPKMRDFGWQDGTATILDLEERPWEVMPMPTAQARDVLLWIIDLCSYPVSRAIAPQAMATLLHTMSADTERELRKTVRLLKPLIAPARLIPGQNRELTGAIAAYDTMKTALSEKA